MNSKILPCNFPFKPLKIKPTPKSFTLKPTMSSFTIPTQTSHNYIPNKISDDSYVRVFDTTLRDGEQAPGATMTLHQKLTVAQELATLGVDVIEVGFPISSKAEFDATKLIAKEVGNCGVGASDRVPVIAAVARMVKRDIDTAWEAVRYAKYPRLAVFIPTSEIHLKYKLKKSKDEVLRTVQDMVKYARSLGVMDLGFISEDSARSEKEFLYQVFGEAIKAGATTITFCDTVGCKFPDEWGQSEKEFLYQVFGEAIKAGATTITFCDTVGCKFPDEWGQFIADMKANIVGVENVIISTHCHNDLGLATANTLAAVSAGARQVDVTINGIGERAGNAPLEEVVMALKSRGHDLLEGLHTGINTKHIVATSNMVEKYSGLSLQPHKPIVGSNAFVHGSGIHQDGVLKNRSTYEFISPEDIGLSRSSTDNGIVLGKLSGRAAVKSRYLELGYEFDEENFEKIFWRFKTVAENKKLISDAELVTLACNDGSKELAQQSADMQAKNVV